jgi:hypothetical protein
VTAKFGSALFLLARFIPLLGLVLPPAPARAACVVDDKATIPLSVIGMRAITVPVEVNDIRATFILDTGAQRSVVTQEAVQRLGMARDKWVGTTMSGVGGIDRRPNANPRSLSLGGVKLVRRTLNRDFSMTVGLLPGRLNGDLIIDGLLGRDFLSLFDLDLDVPGRRLTLYQVKDCDGRFLPWTGNYAAVPVSMPAEEAIVVPVTVDGKPLRALLDTGAGASLLTAPGMRRLGLTQAGLTGDPAGQISGLGPRVLVVHRHRFTSLRVGDLTVEQPVLWVEPIRPTPIVDMLLGADWLAERRVWISFATRQLFVATD